MSVLGISSVSDLYPIQIKWHDKVLQVLSNTRVSAKEILDVLSENLKIKTYYIKSAGVSEGYTVGQHTEMVLVLALKYKGCLEPQISEYLKWEDFLLFLALHDIGKGVSKEIAPHSACSGKQLELEATQKILTEACELLWVRSSIGHIFQALLMYDSQGNYLKGDIDAECIKGHLLDMSAASELAPEAIYKIYSVFHLVDAASYPNLAPLFIYGSDTLQHCEANQSLVDYLYQALKS